MRIVVSDGPVRDGPRSGEPYQVLHRHRGRLVDRFEEGQEMVRVPVGDGDADIVVGVVLRRGDTERH